MGWTQKASTSHYDYANSGVLYSGALYVMPGSYSNGYNLYNKVLKYFLSTNTWSTLTPSGDGPEAEMLGHSSVLYNGKIYRFGGIDEEGTTVFDKLYEYDIATNTWDEKTAAPVSRNFHTAVVYDGKMFVYGGGSDAWTGATDTLYEYDFSTDTWTSRGTGTGPRMFHSAVVSGQYMYIYAGWDDEDADTSTLYRCDLSSFTWSTLTAGVAKDAHAAVLLDTTMYAICGCTGETVLDDFYTYAIGSGSWTQLSDAPISRQMFLAVTDGTDIYIYGGLDEGLYVTQTLYQYSQSDPTATPKGAYHQHYAEKPPLASETIQPEPTVHLHCAEKTGVTSSMLRPEATVHLHYTEKPGVISSTCHPKSAVHLHYADEPALLPLWMHPKDAAHDFYAGSPELIETTVITAEGSILLHYADTPELVEIVVITAENSIFLHYAEKVAAYGELFPDSTWHDHRCAPITVSGEATPAASYLSVISACAHLTKDIHLLSSMILQVVERPRIRKTAWEIVSPPAAAWTISQPTPTTWTTK